MVDKPIHENRQLRDPDHPEARELFFSSLPSPTINPQWHNLFAANESPEQVARYTGVPNGFNSQGTASETELGEAGRSLPSSDAKDPLRQLSQSPPDDDDPEMEIVGAKLSRVLFKDRRTMTINIESNSVYGAAVLMPQVARSSGWNRDLTSLAVSSFLYLMLCIALHGVMLMFMDKEEVILDGFAGQMYLCDFGENIGSCTGHGTECIGPGGTQMSGQRLYTWTQFSTRVFVRDSLKSLFPDAASTIDPGEYGVESYNCRLVCVFLFVISIIPECELCMNMVVLLWALPSKAESWIELEKCEDEPSGEKVNVKVAGMPLFWKAVNFVFVCVPKVVLVYNTAQTGICFLMETAGIDDIIVNSVALGFLLSLDELITDNLMSDGANVLIDMCEGYELYEDDPASGPTLDETATIWHYAVNGVCGYIGLAIRLVFSLLREQLVKLIVAVIITFLFVSEYYMSHCEWKDGRFVSRSMYMPTSMHFNFLNAFLPSLFPFGKEDTPYWTMPEHPIAIIGSSPAPAPSNFTNFTD